MKKVLYIALLVNSVISFAQSPVVRQMHNRAIDEGCLAGAEESAQIAADFNNAIISIFNSTKPNSKERRNGLNEISNSYEVILQQIDDKVRADKNGFTQDIEKKPWQQHEKVLVLTSLEVRLFAYQNAANKAISLGLENGYKQVNNTNAGYYKRNAENECLIVFRK